MKTPEERNIKIFGYFFVHEGGDFQGWLERYLSEGKCYPFVMAGREEYDLGDLLNAILSNFPDQTSRIQQAFIEILQLNGHNLELQKLSAIAYAVARSAFTPVAGELAHTIDRVLETIDLSSSIDDKLFPDLVLHLDVVIASVAGLALKTDDDRLISTCNRLFYNPELALFSSTLFAPLAVKDMKNWPDYWAHVVKMAETKMSLLQIDPINSPIKSQFPENRKRGSHFDLRQVFENFLERAYALGLSIKQILSLSKTANGDEIEKQVQFAFQIVSSNHEAALGIKVPETEDDHWVIFENATWLEQRGLKPTRILGVAKLNRQEFNNVQRYFKKHAVQNKSTSTLKKELLTAAVA